MAESNLKSLEGMLKRKQERVKKVEAVLAKLQAEEEQIDFRIYKMKKKAKTKK